MTQLGHGSLALCLWIEISRKKSGWIPYFHKMLFYLPERPVLLEASRLTRSRSLVVSMAADVSAQFGAGSPGWVCWLVAGGL